MGVTIVKKAIINANNETILDHSHEGYCHELTIHVATNGRVTPKKLNLGNKGDELVTQFIFDLKDLYESNTLKYEFQEHYYGRLVIWDPTKPRDRNEDSLDPNPITYEIDSQTLHGGLWALPKEWTSRAGTYTFIFAIVERTPVDGNVTTETEIFISHEFAGTVNDTDWSTAIMSAIDNATIISDDADAWSKPSIIISPDPLHYTIRTSSKDMGMKFDRYVKRIKLNNNPSVAIDVGLDVRYGVFWRDGSPYYAMKFNDVEREHNTSICWVPEQVSKQAGNWKFMLIAQTEKLNVINSGFKFKRWVSNTLQLSITDNFLEDGDLSLYLDGHESNFVLRDGSIIITSDGSIFWSHTEENN